MFGIRVNGSWRGVYHLQIVKILRNGPIGRLLLSLAPNYELPGVEHCAGNGGNLTEASA